MLLRSFSVLLLLILLGLAMILGYAAWNRNGVKVALDRASALLEDDQPGRAVEILNQVDRSLGPAGDSSDRKRLYRMRYKAHERLGTLRKALLDLDVLLQHLDVGRLELKREKLRILVLAERRDLGPEDAGLRATGVAREILAEHPDDELTHDLAGQAEQELYSKALRTFLARDLADHVPPTTRDETIEQLFDLLYRTQDDPQYEEFRRKFEATLGHHVQSRLTLNKMLADVETIRRRIAQSREHYSHALKGTAPVPGSLLGYGDMLRLAGQSDLAAILPWLYLQRFPNGYQTALAAQRAIRAWMHADNPRQALAVADLWLGEQGPLGHAKQALPDSRWVAAYVELARVYHALAHRTRLGVLADDLARLERGGAAALAGWSLFVRGLYHDLNGDRDEAESVLAEFCASAVVPPRRLREPDYFTEAIRLRFELARSHGDLDSARSISNQWLLSRPTDPIPYLERTRLELEPNGSPEAAMLHALRLIELPKAEAERETALGMLLQAYDMVRKPDGKDSMSIFRHMVQNDMLLPPSPSHPVAYLGIAALAQASGNPDMAIANAERLLNHYSWSTTARYIIAQSYLLKDQPKQAMLELQLVLGRRPDHIGALELKRLALRKLPVDPRRRQAADLALLERQPSSKPAALLLGEALLARGDSRNALRLAEGSAYARVRPEDLYWIKGRALLGLGPERVSEALNCLEKVRAQEDRAPALLMACEAALSAGDRHRTRRLVPMLLETEADAADLLREAELLASAEEYEPALALLEPFVSGHRGLSRNGYFFTLRGRLLLAVGRIEEGIRSLMSGFSFEDGSDAGPLILLALLLEGRQEQADDIARQIPTPEGNPLTLAYLYYLLGEEDKARSQFRKAEIPSPRLRKILARALSLSFDPEARPEKPLDRILLPPLEALIASHPERIFRALALSGTVSFAPRTKEDLRELAEAELDDETELTLQAAYPWTQLLRAYNEELAGRPRDSITRLLRLVEGHRFFLPAYEELFRLVDDEHQELLVTPHMLSRYMLVIAQFGVGMIQTYSDPRMIELLLQAQSRFAIQGGYFELSKNLLELAFTLGIHDPLKSIDQGRGLDPKTANLLIDGLLREDLDLALRHQIELLAELGHPAPVPELRRAFERALSGIALSLTKHRLAVRSIESKLQHLIQIAREYHALAKTPKRPPLGVAALLIVKAMETYGPGVGSDLVEESRDVLHAYLKPFTSGRIPPGVDVQGLLAVLQKLLELEETRQVLEILDRILEQDPSLIELWLLHARIDVSSGRYAEARKTLSWLSQLLPSPRVLVARSRLEGELALGDSRSYSWLLGELEKLPGTGPDLSYARSLMQLRLGYPKRALELVADLDLDPLSAQSHFRDLAAILSRQTGRFREISGRMRARARLGADIFRGSEDLASQLERLVESLDTGDERSNGNGEPDTGK